MNILKFLAVILKFTLSIALILFELPFKDLHQI